MEWKKDILLHAQWGFALIKVTFSTEDLIYTFIFAFNLEERTPSTDWREILWFNRRWVNLGALNWSLRRFFRSEWPPHQLAKGYSRAWNRDRTTTENWKLLHRGLRLWALIERFSFDLEMKTREQNRNNKRTEIERFDWFIERIQTRVAFGWLSERSGEKTSFLRTFLKSTDTSVWRHAATRLANRTLRSPY